MQHGGGGDRRIVLPAKEAVKIVALGKACRARLHHQPHRQRPHRAAQPDRLGIIRHITRPSALGRIDRQIDVADQHFAIGRHRNLGLVQSEMFRLRHSGRSGLQDHAAVAGGPRKAGNVTRHRLNPGVRGTFGAKHRARFIRGCDGQRQLFQDAADLGDHRRV